MNKKILIITSFILIVAACSDQDPSLSISDKSDAQAMPINSVATTVQDKNKKFIHTVNINMEVKDVLKSTLAIEKNVLNFGGFITQSKLDSRITTNKVTPVSRDSARETKIYSMSNYMEIRIPQPYLSNFLSSLNQEIDFLHHRNIEAKDATFEVKSLDMNKRRLQQNLEKNPDNILEKDQTEIAKDIINDQINFSTIIIQLKEKEKVKSNIIVNTENYNLYTFSDFGYQIKRAFLIGFEALQHIVIVLFYLWPLWLFLGMAALVYKKYKKRKSLSTK